MRFFILLLAGASLHAHPVKNPHSKTPYTAPSEAITLGSGSHQYTLHPSWLASESNLPKIGHGHALVEDSKGNIYFANASKKNCIIVFSPEGKILKAWGDFCKEAHGLQIIKQDDKEFLFIADSEGHTVFKTTLDGEIIMTLKAPLESKLYEKEEEFKPSKTMHLPNGDFYVIDGYGKDFIHLYSADGTYKSSFGGTLGKGEAQLKHWGPHGGAIDFSDPKNPTILLALSDQQKLKRFTLDGQHLQTIPMTGGNPRDIIFHGDVIFIPHLGDAWPQNRTSPGVISIHDRKTLKLITTLGGAKDTTVKNPYAHSEHTFLHPHGLLISSTGDLYLAQFASQNTWPLKFQPAK